MTLAASILRRHLPLLQTGLLALVFAAASLPALAAQVRVQLGGLDEELSAAALAALESKAGNACVEKHGYPEEIFSHPRLRRSLASRWQHETGCFNKRRKSFYDRLARKRNQRSDCKTT